MAFRRGMKDDFFSEFAYGRRPEMQGKGDGYPEMMKEDTDLAAKARGEVYDHSDMRKPYFESDYEKMERTYPNRQPAFYNPDIDLQRARESRFDIRGARPPLERYPFQACGLTLSAESTAPIGDTLTVSVFDCQEFWQRGVTLRASGCFQTGDPNNPFIDTRPFTWEVISGPGSISGITQDRDGDCSETAVITVPQDSTEAVLVKVTDAFGCEAFYTINAGDCGCPMSELTITAANGVDDETTANASKRFWLLGPSGLDWSNAPFIHWSVTGTGASISDGTLVTSGACGSLTITATDDCGNSVTQDVRVTDSGTWSGWTNICSVGVGCTAESGCACCGGTGGGSCTSTSGKYNYLVAGKCLHGESPNCPGNAPCDAPCTIDMSGCNCGEGTPLAHPYQVDRREWICV